MIRIMLFASLREKLACDGVELQAMAETETVAGLIARLVVEQGPLWQQVLGDEQVMVAVNQEVANLHTQVAAGDEVAFFPPVTGG